MGLFFFRVKLPNQETKKEAWSYSEHKDKFWDTCYCTQVLKEKPKKSKMSVVVLD